MKTIYTFIVGINMCFGMVAFAAAAEMDSPDDQVPISLGVQLAGDVLTSSGEIVRRTVLGRHL